ncbi:MAG: adenosylmethionine--8-amino-7-oxononanoate transaminase [Zymomonas mobilis]|uniref:Adenosylmethionine-8-amino-7-oxononanoate aminotransferase n=1 Tax=Zymomonas mobilis TaxID=542 RepID=A0A542VYX2_ZYMMB|nr:adenosylmethionine--8-amino-7-oxononanoate transaminase [Zymomonas mobilis]TQL16528.1 adenosylmethionine-8-amino-7-oxononanoate aminotransferase [Zymomonas mobilis]
MQNPDWLTEGLSHIWLPYTQMQTMTAPVPAVATEKSSIYLANGRELVDGIASWWTACHGYNHPYIRKQAEEQLRKMPHIMFGGIVHEQALRLASRLSDMLPGNLNHVFFSDSGSVAVEVALKMAMQYWLNKGEKKRKKLLAFRGGYHGDTMATMAICDPEEGMHSLFTGILPEHYIVDLPKNEEKTANLELFLQQHHREIAAIIVEPLIQGAGGMLFHSPEVLKKLRYFANKYNLLLIFDEIFTGFGRTGTMFACEQAGVTPDIITLSKALTGGTMALAATVATTSIFKTFLSDNPVHALMHGPTFMANPLACACANASLDLFEKENRLDQVAQISQQMLEELAPCRALSCVKDVRVMGAVGVVELKETTDINQLKSRLLQQDVWIRPFLNIVYLTPAFTITPKELNSLTTAIYNVLSQNKDV